MQWQGDARKFVKVCNIDKYIFSGSIFGTRNMWYNIFWNCIIFNIKTIFFSNLSNYKSRSEGIGGFFTRFQPRFASSTIHKIWLHTIKRQKAANFLVSPKGRTIGCYKCVPNEFIIWRSIGIAIYVMDFALCRAKLVLQKLVNFQTFQCVVHIFLSK